MEARTVLVVCALIAIMGSLLYHEKWAKPWMPNVVVGALTIGLTATIVEALLTRAQRRAESERVQPVLDVALRSISEALYYFLRSAANGYASSNLTSFRAELPRDLDGWLALLIDELPNADEPNPLLRPGLSPVLLASGLRGSLDAIAARDSDVLLRERPRLLAAIHAFHAQMEEQLFFLRPVPGWAQYKTPIKNLWMCGSATHPGGGIMGAPGRLAALEILKHSKATAR